MCQYKRESLELMFERISDRYLIASLLESIGYDPSLKYTEAELHQLRNKINKGQVYSLCHNFSCGGLRKTRNYVRNLIV